MTKKPLEAWRILLVDDDEDDYLRLRTMLSQAHSQTIQLEWARSYQAGLDLLQTNCYQAILVEYDLGPSTGIQLIRAGVDLNCPAPFILYSGRGGDEIDLEAMQAGATLYLTKAEANPLLLDRVLRYAIERKRIEAELDRRLQERTELLESLQDGFLAIDRAWRITYANRWSADHAGLQPDELTGRSLWQAFPRFLSAPFTANFRRVMDDRQPVQFEYQSPANAERMACRTPWYNLSAYPAEDGISVFWQDISARKQAEEQIRYQAGLLANVSEAVISTSPDFIIRSWNQAAEALYGWTAEEAIGRVLGELVPIEYQNTTRAAVLQEFQTSGRWKGEVIQTTRSGVRVYVLASVVALKDERGQPVGVVSVNHDNSDRRRVEEALQAANARLLTQTEELVLANEQLAQKEQHFRGVVESFPYGLIIYDARLRYLYANGWVQRITGLDWERLAGKTDQELFPSHAIKAYRAGLQQAFTQAASHSFEWQMPALMGGRTVVVRCVPLLEAGGHVYQLLVAFEDISERKLADQTLRASEERFRSLFNSMTEGFAVHEIITDAAGQPCDYRFLDINPAFEQLTGLARAGVVGRTFTEVLPGEDPTWLRRFGQVALTGEADRFENYAPILKRHYEVFAYRPAPRQFAVIFTDITIRKQAEADRQVYTEQLRRSNAELMDFAFIASHDLREPLRKIQAFGDRLNASYSQALGERGREYIERMRQAAGRMDHMLDGLLAYSRIATQPQPFQPVDLGQLAAEVLSDLEFRLAQTGGQVEIGDLPVIQADPLQMRQLLQNLLSNGLKFHQPGLPPRVSISSRPGAPGLVELVVADNGIGFDMQQAARLFTPFTRLGDKNAYEGTGMGLAICRKIVERHGGSIAAAGAPGAGATFTVSLPNDRLG